MTKQRHAPKLLPLTLAFAFAGTACTQAGDEALAEDSALSAMDDRPPPGGPGHRPPREALEACEGKAAGDACTVVLPDREIDGTCTAPPEGAPDHRLFCLPEGAPPPPQDGRCPQPPPPEAFAACEDLAVGEACTVRHGDESIEGTCLTPPWDDEAPTACLPQGGPPRE